MIFSVVDWGWGVVGLGLLLLAYTAWVVKNEKNQFLKSARTLEFASFRFLIPSWWHPQVSTEERLEFVRKDSRYEWKAVFEFHKKGEGKSHPQLSLEDILKEKLQEWKVVLDPKASWSPVREGIRLEGTGTFNHEERIYLDVFLTEDKRGEGLLFLSSWSSVLVGLIEGPYFEETLTRMQPLDHL